MLGIPVFKPKQIKRDISKTDRLKLVVLDANFKFVERFFLECSNFSDVLLLRPRDFRSFRKYYGSCFIDFKPKPVTEGVWEQRICCPPGWLFHYWLITKLFFSYLIKKFQDDYPLIFVFVYPYYCSLIHKFKAHSIYFNLDDYQFYWPKRKEQTQRLEGHAVNSADLTICVSYYRTQLLKQMYPSRADNIFYIPLGSTPEFISEYPLREPKSLPAELQHYKRPLCGYIGALNYRFDYNYLSKVAEELRDITFILGGSIPQQREGNLEWWKGVQKARNLSNINFIGPVNNDRLGEYLQSFDVLLMIYSNCEFNLNCTPSKLWEYLGASMPIVANRVVPELNQWDNFLLISRSPEEFAANVKFALANPGWLSKERWEAAQANTWKIRSQKLYSLLQDRNWVT